MSTQATVHDLPRCTLCPACCRLGAVRSGPDTWRVEPARTAGQGLCPRGSSLVDLMTHHRRIRQPRVRGRPAELRAALGALLEQAGDGGLTVLLDGTQAVEPLAAAAAWSRAWPALRLCFVLEPADEQLLLGLEASGARYLAHDDLEHADGFLIVGDAFSANPTVSRAVFNARARSAATPIVVLDPGAGPAAKFATHRIPVRPARELVALAALARAAGVKTRPSFAALAGWETTSPAAADGLAFCMGAAPGLPTAESCIAALRTCKRPVVLVAADYGRGPSWRALGFLLGHVAAKLSAAVAPQTRGANALAALRLGTRCGALSLAEALSAPGARLAIGCDPLGLVGWTEPPVTAAAAALPSPTTEAAEIVLPLALPGETGGLFHAGGAGPVRVAPLLPPPAGTPTAAQLLAALAAAANRPHPAALNGEDGSRRAEVPAPAAAPEIAEPAECVLLLAAGALHTAASALTGHCRWQAGLATASELRVAPARAQQWGLANLETVEVLVDGRSAPARVRVDPELDPFAVVLAEGQPALRRLLPGRIDAESGAVVAGPAAVEVRATHERRD